MGFGSYETAWAWLHKLRRAMVRPGKGAAVGVSWNSTRACSAGESRGKPGAGIGQSADDDRGRAARQSAVWAGSGSIWPTGRKGMDHGRLRHARSSPAASTIKTDGGIEAHADSPASATSIERIVGLYSPVTSTWSCPDVHMVASLLKRWLSRHLAPPAQPPAPALLPGRVHLPVQPADLHEPAGCCSTGLLQQAADTDPHPLSELIGGTGNDWDEPPDH